MNGREFLAIFTPEPGIKFEEGLSQWITFRTRSIRLRELDTRKRPSLHCSLACAPLLCLLLLLLGLPVLRFWLEEARGVALRVCVHNEDLLFVTRASKR